MIRTVLLATATLLTACATPQAATTSTAFPTLSPDCRAPGFAMIVHGGTSSGAGADNPRMAARLDFIERMLGDQQAALASGAQAVDVVEAAVVAMEDSGLFNAGRAAIANAGGFVETDASIMDGRDLDAGAVASMRRIKNPIRAARLVMDETRHVFMVGDRGETAVIGLGADTVEDDYFLNNKPVPGAETAIAEHGTVGAAVRDCHGDLAAGTSTGGYDSKIPGRVGDSPIIGAGSYAKNGVMAASSTGHGEYYIRHTALRSIAARMEYGGQGIVEAAQATIEEMRNAGRAADPEGRDGLGGIVAVSADGAFALPFSTPGMVRGTVRDDEAPNVGVLEAMRP